MSILQNSIVPASAGGGYEIANSLRFNDNDSAYLSRTPASAGNRKTWTWSGWVKRGEITTGGGGQSIFYAGNTVTTARGGLVFGNGGTDQLSISGMLFNGTTGVLHLETTAEFRDVSAWYHIVVSLDTTQATASDRCKIYVNGTQETALDVATYPALNAELQYNDAILHATRHPAPDYYFNGYLAEVNFIDGQALDPSNFGETGDYGEWKPIKYTGTYGNNGFYLDFENSGSLGADVSGNGNNWTPTNLAATDQMLDSPTNNFATFNVLTHNTSGATTYAQGNLQATTPVSSGGFGVSTIRIPDGKYYAEFVFTSTGTSPSVGVSELNPTAAYPVTDTGIQSAYYDGYGAKWENGSNSLIWSTFTAGDIIGISCNNGVISFYKNNTLQGSVTLTSDALHFVTSDGSGGSGSTVIANFGQDSSFAGNKTSQGNADDNGYGDFYYAPPTGYLALCTQNLPEPTVVPSEHFNTITWSANGTNTTRSFTGVGFAPDFVWAKKRSGGTNHQLYDTVRGAGNNKELESNTTVAEGGSNAEIYGYIGSFDADGFTGTAGTDGSYPIDYFNGTGSTYVAWNWKANGAGVSNTNGTITSTVSANVDAGFSIVSYTGTGVAGATVGHGLNSKPEIIIIKSRSGSAKSWYVYHEGLHASSPEDYRVELNTTNATSLNTTGNSLQGTVPTNSLFTLGNGTWVNENTKTLIAYAFHSVEGYSKVGSYTGNGSTDGTFVYCGFRPAYVMVKKTSSTSDWLIIDSTRDTYNDATQYGLAPNSSGAESDSYYGLEAVSNGFKLRYHDAWVNTSGATYIFLAFAEHPFKYTNAR